ncbi:MAG: Protein containing DUF4213 and DUF364 domain [Candidatus Methanohalarchaeum thermophilum]|uniref:Protein containing DUF4213 and DUF364 domain n=1 Tax=Methanohalarchaeum thermophilum TaxID=1903181 RepID=A0A1Q6DTD8_METT1|nr:MAG: Protein containing DUF4213 and DUF364 domain [Candidatus Methanohalarchaeum thermophilum]
MEMISDILLEEVKERLRGTKIRDLRIGISYTGILLDSGEMGVSYSFAEEKGSCCDVVEDAGDFLGKDAVEVAKLINQPSAIVSSLGMAAMNAVFNQGRGEKGDLLDFLGIRKNESVGMVGDFRPVISKIDQDIELFVFERNSNGPNTYPDYAAERILPEVDLAIISGTTILNNTLDHLLDLCQSARKIALLGPTTPMAPEAFVDKNVDILAGSMIKNEKNALEVISQGGGTHALHDSIEKYNIIIS